MCRYQINWDNVLSSSKCTKTLFRLGGAPDPAEGAYDATTDSHRPSSWPRRVTLTPLPIPFPFPLDAFGFSFARPMLFLMFYFLLLTLLFYFVNRYNSEWWFLIKRRLTFPATVRIQWSACRAVHERFRLHEVNCHVIEADDCQHVAHSHASGHWQWATCSAAITARSPSYPAVPR